MQRMFLGLNRAEATRKADDWWWRQKGLRQTLRTEMAAGAKGPDTTQLDQWAVTIHFEREKSKNRADLPGDKGTMVRRGY